MTRVLLLHERYPTESLIWLLLGTITTTEIEPGDDTPASPARSSASSRVLARTQQTLAAATDGLCVGGAWFERFGERSAALTKLGQELGGREDRQIRLVSEEVLVGGHEIRAGADGQGKEVVVVGVG
jgi:hypothetical protein